MEPNYLLSICIPTYNRATHLRNCLSSLIQSNVAAQPEVQVCISDNCSTDHTRQVIDDATSQLKIKYRKNASNLGLAKNIVEVVQMADGEFIWMLGDDDLLIPGGIERIIGLIRSHDKVDYFYVNSYILTNEYINCLQQPFDIKNLPKTMKTLSAYSNSGEFPFFKLINPRISFCYLSGIFSSVFRREMWLENVSVLDRESLSDNRVFSHFDNTFPHMKIFAKAFANSRAYFSAEPSNIFTSMAQEWGAMWPLIRSIRLPEGIDVYRKHGLPYLSYLYYKNASLGWLLPDVIRLIFNKKESGYRDVNIPRILINNCMYPNFYLSLASPFFSKSFWRKLGAFLRNTLFPNSKL